MWSMRYTLNSLESIPACLCEGRQIGRFCTDSHWSMYICKRRVRKYGGGMKVKVTGKARGKMRCGDENYLGLATESDMQLHTYAVGQDVWGFSIILVVWFVLVQGKICIGEIMGRPEIETHFHCATFFFYDHHLLSPLNLLRRKRRHRPLLRFQTEGDAMYPTCCVKHVDNYMLWIFSGILVIFLILQMYVHRDEKANVWHTVLTFRLLAIV